MNERESEAGWATDRMSCVFVKVCVCACVCELLLGWLVRAHFDFGESVLNDNDNCRGKISALFSFFLPM